MKTFVAILVIIIAFSSCSRGRRKVEVKPNYTAKVTIIPDGNVTFISTNNLQFFKKGDTIPVLVMLKAPQHNTLIGKWEFNEKPLFSKDTIVDQKFPIGVYTYRNTRAKIDSIFTRNPWMLN